MVGVVRMSKSLSDFQFLPPLPLSQLPISVGDAPSISRRRSSRTLDTLPVIEEVVAEESNVEDLGEELNAAYDEKEKSVGGREPDEKVREVNLSDAEDGDSVVASEEDFPPGDFRVTLGLVESDTSTDPGSELSRVPERYHKYLSESRLKDYREGNPIDVDPIELSADTGPYSCSFSICIEDEVLVGFMNAYPRAAELPDDQLAELRCLIGLYRSAHSRMMLWYDGQFEQQLYSYVAAAMYVA